MRREEEEEVVEEVGQVQGRSVCLWFQTNISGLVWFVLFRFFFFGLFFLHQYIYPSKLCCSLSSKKEKKGGGVFFGVFFTSFTQPAFASYWEDQSGQP